VAHDHVAPEDRIADHDAGPDHAVVPITVLASVTPSPTVH